jgi:Leucine-rich repeat (LRR) protein
LAALPALELLDLSQDKLTDESVEHLKKLTKLKTLNLAGTTLSDAARASLKEALPDCQIIPDSQLSAK